MTDELIGRLRDHECEWDFPCKLCDSISALEAKAKEIAALSKTHGATERHIEKLESQLTTIRTQVVEECAKVAEAEPNFPGEPEADHLRLMVSAGPIPNIRAAGLAMKREIARNIRALSPPGENRKILENHVEDSVQEPLAGRSSTEGAK